ncbi:MAG: lipoyl(octanoyl) transferase LipB [Chloroherpetonaceae bacterium]|nr:lipoyl(octanoyl) transferase LipB [Chloroherpetonaceae bacterium]
MEKKQTNHFPLGRMPYREAWALQRHFFNEVSKDESSDVLLSVEHLPVFTLGKTAKHEHLLIDEDLLKAEGIEILNVDRGGDITFHGIGQLVVYPIVNLKRRKPDIHVFLRDLEECVILTLDAFGIRAYRKSHPDKSQNYTGVWVGNQKICAMGIRYSRFTTMHGLALNVTTNMQYFRHIVPCGISEYPVTSMHEIIGQSLSLEVVTKAFLKSYSEIFETAIVTNESLFTFG